MIIGITGGIGSGKSRVARFWTKIYGVECVDLDGICRGLMEKGRPGWLALQACFQDRFFCSDGTLDRAGLRQAIFTDKGLRARLDSMIHPLARQEMAAHCRRHGGGILLAEIPLLFEAGWQEDVDRIVVVVARNAVRSARIMARDGSSPEQSRQAMAAQSCQLGKAMAADHVVDNSGPWAWTSLQVARIAVQYAGTTS